MSERLLCKSEDCDEIGSHGYGVGPRWCVKHAPRECETCEGPCDRERLADFLTPVPDLDYGAKGTDYRPVPAPLPDLPDEHLDYPRPRPSPIDPPHYLAHPSGVECIQIAEHMGFCLGNAIKYIWRAGLKSSDPKEDLEKAIWYLRREIERLSRPPHE